MSMENEDQHLLDQPEESSLSKNSRISYSRDFLLSLSGLDVCKKFPSGFDPSGFDRSILCEFEDASQDRVRSSSSLPLQSFRRNDYSSSPPTRGESGNFSRSIGEKWNSRSSARNDKDTDSQSDRDSDSGKHYGNQSRRSWQGSEHDGLLGSGSFSRTGYTTKAAVPKLPASDQGHLNKSNEPYHPPRPYKAPIFSKRDNKDAFNDETFGSSEVSCENKAEEEKKRRASFESMRKEHKIEFEEKQKLNPNGPKDKFMLMFSENPKLDKGLANIKDESMKHVEPKASNADSEKTVFASQTLVSRPLVPPGFTSTKSEKNNTNNTLLHSHLSELHNPESQAAFPATCDSALGGTSSNHETRSLKPTGLSEQRLEKEPILNSSSAIDIPNEKLSKGSQPYSTSSPSQAFAGSEGTVTRIDAEEITKTRMVNNFNINPSTEILEKLFGGSLRLKDDDYSSSAEHIDDKADDRWDPGSVQSSKFAQWFLDEGKRPVDNFPSSEPNDLLSLIVGGEKLESMSLDVKSSTETITPKPPFQSSEIGGYYATSTLTSMTPTVKNSEHLYLVNQPEPVPVLTCEDLEQSMLLEVTENASILQSSSNPSSAKTVQQKSGIDDHASQHLLSLLQKRITPKDTAESSTPEGKSFGEHINIESVSIGSALGNSNKAKSESVKPLTLETFFGTSFMKELHSGISVQMGSVGPECADASENHGGGVLPSNQRTNMLKEHFLGDDPRNESKSSNLRTALMSKHGGGYDVPVDIRLPQDLISVNDSVDLFDFMPLRSSAKNEYLSSQETPKIISEELGHLRSGMWDEKRSVAGGHEGQPFRDIREPDILYQNPNVHQSSSQLHSLHLNRVGPLFRQLDPHAANNVSEMNFMGTDGVTRNDTQANYQFPANMLHPSLHHANDGLTSFDPTGHQTMLQQMQIPANFPPQLRGFPRGPPASLHMNNQIAGYMQDTNQQLGRLPFGYRQPHVSGFGNPSPAPSDVGGGSNPPPQVLQKLMEMELSRSNSKQVHPFAASSHNQGMYSHELDMSFGHR